MADIHQGKVIADPQALASSMGYPDAKVVRAEVRQDPFRVIFILEGDQFPQGHPDRESVVYYFPEGES